MAAVEERPKRRFRRRLPVMLAGLVGSLEQCSCLVPPQPMHSSQKQHYLPRRPSRRLHQCIASTEDRTWAGGGGRRTTRKRMVPGTLWAVSVPAGGGDWSGGDWESPEQKGAATVWDEKKSGGIDILTTANGLVEAWPRLQECISSSIEEQMERDISSRSGKERQREWAECNSSELRNESEPLELWADSLTTFLLQNGAAHYEVASTVQALEVMYKVAADTSSTVLPRVRIWADIEKQLTSFLDSGFSGSDLANMVQEAPQLLDMDFNAYVSPTMEFLKDFLAVRPTDVRRILRRAPQVLLTRHDGSTAVDTIEALRALGMSEKVLKMEASRWPKLLSYPAADLFDVAAWLSGEEVGIPHDFLSTIFRQAPWIIERSMEKELKPAVQYLKGVGVISLDKVLRAYPQILCLNIETELKPRVQFLLDDVKITEEDLPRVLQSFPLLFAVPMARMRGVLELFGSELGISLPDVTKIVRAFPSLLGLEPERHIGAVVTYLRSLGIQNIGRFVSRLPPVLGYDVTTNLMPKMEYLVESMGLSVYDVLTFPAYLSYPLETLIEPRAEFLKLRRRPIAVVGLNTALTSGDNDFAKFVAKVGPDIYLQFKQTYAKHRRRVISNEISTQDVLELSGTKQLGSLGGLSASANVEQITGARRLTDEEAQKLQEQRMQDRPDSPT